MQDMLKTKKDGTRAYKPECDGLLVATAQCDGEVALATKRALSFGYPFATHSYLCDAHARMLGFTK